MMIRFVAKDQLLFTSKKYFDQALSVKIIIILLCFLMFNASASAESTIDLVPDKHKNNAWVLSYVTKNSVHASVNGQATHGDRLHVRFVKGKCDVGNLLTFVYTYSKNPNILKLKNRYVTTKFMGRKVTVKVLFTYPFLMGHRSTVDLGWMLKDDLIKYLSKETLISITYLDSKEINITEYFDINHNNWVNLGLGNAIEKASAICKTL